MRPGDALDLHSNFFYTIATREGELRFGFLLGKHWLHALACHGVWNSWTDNFGSVLPCPTSLKVNGNAISHFTLIQEKKSVSRLLPLDSGPVLKEIKNQEQLAQLMKSITVRNGWKNEDLASIPVWLLTGHIVVEANPNLLIDLSKRSAG